MSMIESGPDGMTLSGVVPARVVQARVASG